MRKNYITTVIKRDYTQWGKRKVFLNAPTGSGKTYFVINELLTYVVAQNQASLHKNQKLLILCNRRALRMQYLYALAEKNDSYTESKDNVDVKTYQEVGEGIQNGKDVVGSFAKYTVIVLDEVHYFYQDADFNGQGTYPLFLAIMLAYFSKQMIFISATGECVEEHIRRTLERAKWFVNMYEIRGYCSQSDLKDKSLLEYLKPTETLKLIPDYLNCICVPDQETLCGELGSCKGKSVIFVEDKELAEHLAEKFVKTGKIKREEICLLNADNFDKETQNEVVEMLAMVGKLIPRVLITTAVLDNGISIKDPDVKNLVILTESKVSFMQMLGRVRYESVEEKLNLFFLQRPVEYFRRRKEKCERIIKALEEVTKQGIGKYLPQILTSLLEDDERASIFRKFVCWFPDELNYCEADMKASVIRQGKICFSINPFAERKIGDQCQAERNFYKWACEDIIKPVVEQLRWIGLDKEDLTMHESTYSQERRNQLKYELLKVEQFTNQELQEFKKNINKEFRGDILADMNLKAGQSFSTAKLYEIAERFGCRVVEVVGKDGNKRYTIERNDEGGDEGADS